MAWLVGDGWDFYSSLTEATTGASPLWTAGANLSSYALLATTPFGVGQSVRAANVGDVIYRDTGSNDPEIILNFRILYNAALASSSFNHTFTLSDGATAQCSVCVNRNGNITLTSGSRSGSALATYTGAYLGSTWTHFQVRVVIDNTTGSIRIRKDGSTSDSFSSTGLNTRGGTANNYANRILLGSGLGDNTQYMDDFYAFSTTGGIPNDWQGDVRAVQLMPDADPASPLFSRFPASGTRFSKIDELIQNGDTDYIFHNNPGDQDDYGVTDLSTTPASIVAVQAKMLCKKSDAGGRSGDIYVNSGASSANFGSTALSTTYGYLNMPLGEDPDTSSAWTASGVNAITLGVKVSA